MTPISVHVGDEFIPHVGAAIHRLRYLYPKVDFQWTADSSELVAVSPEGPADQVQLLQREINYALYREKIFVDTLAIRQKIVGVETVTILEFQNVLARFSARRTGSPSVPALDG